MGKSLRIVFMEDCENRENKATGNFVLSSDGKILTCNSVFRRIFKFPSLDSAMNTNFFDLYSDSESKDLFLKQLYRYKTLEFYEIELTRHDGKYIYVIENVAGEFDENGKLLEIKGSLLDVTQRKEMERQFMQTQKMESLGTLASGIAHDFNNTLAVINAYTDMSLLKADPDDELKEALEKIKETSRQASLLIQQILAFSRKQKVQPIKFSLNKAVEKTGGMLKPLLGDTIQLKMILDPEIGNVCIDPVQLEQIILNLAINARDAMPGGGQLTIKTSEENLDELSMKLYPGIVSGHFVVLKIKDTGIGMNSKIKEKIFEPFFTTKEKHKGTGLGLSTVYGIVRQNQGDIKVTSRVGKGTTFKVYLPVAEKEE